MGLVAGIGLIKDGMNIPVVCRIEPAAGVIGDALDVGVPTVRIPD